MIIIFGIVIFVVIIMESYVAVKMSERIDALEEANASLQQQINDFYGDQPISLDTNSICSYFSGYISDIKKDSYNINVDLILRNYQDNTIAQVIFKTDKDTYTLSLNKEEDHFNGTINLPIQTLQSTQLISQTNGETNSEVLDIDVNFENYLDEDASGGIMLESYNEKRTKVILLFHLVEIRQRKMKSICGIKNIILKEIQNIMMWKEQFILIVIKNILNLNKNRSAIPFL